MSAKQNFSSAQHEHLTPLQRQVLTHDIHNELPQTQCQRCGFQNCLAYAQAIAEQQAAINRCQPGGAEGVARLAKITHQKPMPLAADVGDESPRILAFIDETWCIGCTKCMRICPVDAIIGSHKKMHIILESACTGCELCIPVCPTDCIKTAPTSEQQPQPTGWAAWSKEQAYDALARYERRTSRQKARPSTLSQNEVVTENIATTSEHEKRDFMAEILRKAQSKITNK